MTEAGFVRPARASDAAELVRVQVACWRDGYTGLVPDEVLTELTGEAALTLWQERWLDAITNPPTSRHKVLVAVADPVSGPTADSARPASGPTADSARPAYGPAAVSARVVVGLASAGPAGDEDRWPGTDAELYELRVLPERTGHGHGGRLLHAVVDTLAEDGFHTASTWTLEADARLRGFLESAGWAADGARAELDVGAALPAIRLHTRITESPPVR